MEGYTRARVPCSTDPKAGDALSSTSLMKEPFYPFNIGKCTEADPGSFQICHPRDLA